MLTPRVERRQRAITIAAVRLPFTMSTALSLLLFIATVALAASPDVAYYWQDVPFCTYVYAVFSANYRFGVHIHHGGKISDGNGDYFHLAVADYPVGWQREAPAALVKPSRDNHILGFQYQTLNTSVGFQKSARLESQSERITVPIWALLLLFAAMPVAWTIRFRQVLRRRQCGCCRACGYDLKANASGIWPRMRKTNTPCAGEKRVTSGRSKSSEYPQLSPLSTFPGVFQDMKKFFGRSSTIR